MDIAWNIMRNSAGRVSDDLPLRAILDASAFSDVYGVRTYVMPSTGENILDIRLTVPFYPCFSLFLLGIRYLQFFLCFSYTPLFCSTSSITLPFRPSLLFPPLFISTIVSFFHPYFPSFFPSSIIPYFSYMQINAFSCASTGALLFNNKYHIKECLYVHSGTNFAVLLRCGKKTRRTTKISRSVDP